MTAAVSSVVNRAVVETLVDGAFSQSFKIADDVVASIDDAIEHLGRNSGTGYGSNFQRSMISASVSAGHLHFPGGAGAGHIGDGIKLLRSADDIGEQMSELSSAAYRATDADAAAALKASANGLRPEATKLLEDARATFGYATQDARDAAEGVVFTLLR